jgi:hypothetical protein
MKQQDAYKLLAAFMILIMIIVPVAYVVTSPRSDLAAQTPEQQSQQEKYNPEFWSVNQPFDSISDALNMTPHGVVTANYVDIESMTPQMVQWARMELPILNEVDSIYKSNTTRMYYASLQYGKNISFLLLSTMFPEKNDFEYIVPLWAPYKGYYILQRQEQGISGIFNIMGNPVIFAPPQTAVDVVDIITSLNKTTTAYDQYEGLLSKVEPASYQMISSNVTFAKQFYLGVRAANGSYERTAAYLDINSSTLKKLNQLKANSTQKGFVQYNITRSGNYTLVKIVSPELLKVVNEEVS